MDIRKIILKYKDTIPYGIFGVLTTFVNISVYWGMAHPMGMGIIPSTIVAWGVAVVFAYLTNRKWVFHSEAHTPQEILKEIISFFVCRIATGIIDWACMYIFVNVLYCNDIISKTIANVLVIILNYVAGITVIFKKSTKQT